MPRSTGNPLTRLEAEAILATGRPLTAEERARLPLVIFEARQITQKTWGGVMIRETPLPTEGRRHYGPTPEDEEAWTIHFHNDRW